MGTCCSNPETEHLLTLLDKQEFAEAHQFFDSHRDVIDPNYCFPRGGDGTNSWTIISKLSSLTYREHALLENFLFYTKSGKPAADPFVVPTSSPLNAIHLLLTSPALHDNVNNGDDEEEDKKDSSPFVMNHDDDDDEDDEKNENNKKESLLTSPLGTTTQPSSFVKTLTMVFKAAGLLKGEEKRYNFLAQQKHPETLPQNRSQLLFALLMIYLQVNLSYANDNVKDNDDEEKKNRRSLKIKKIKNTLQFFFSLFKDNEIGKEVINQQVEDIHRAITVSQLLTPESTIFHILAAKDKTGEIFEEVLGRYYLEEQLRGNNKTNEPTSPTTQKKLDYLSYMRNEEDKTPKAGESQELPHPAEQELQERNKKLLFDQDYRTPLMVACESFNVEMVKLFALKKMGGDVRHASVYSANAFHLLATAALPPPPREQDPSLQNQDSSARFFTAEQENAEEENIVTTAAKLAKKHREDARKEKEETFLRNQQKSAELTQLLLDLPGSKFAREAVDSKKYTPLLYAIQNQNRPLVKLLLENGVKKEFPEGFLEVLAATTSSKKEEGQEQQQQEMSRPLPKNVDEFSDWFGMLDLVGSFKQE